MFLYLLLITWIFAPTPAQPPTGVIQEADYWHLIETVWQDAQRYASVNDPTRLRDAAAQLQTITAVQQPDGHLIPVNHTFLISQLQQENINWSDLIGLLRAMLDERARWPEARYRDPTQAQADLDTILAELAIKAVDDAELAAVEADLREGQWTPNNQTRRVFTLPNIPLPSLFITLLGLVAGFILLLVLLYAFRRLALDFAADHESPPQVEDADENLTAQTALTRAQTLSRQQDYRSAVRYLYLSTLLILDEKGVFRYNRSRTNREYLQSVANKPEVAPVLTDVVEVFDRVWYGYEPIDDEQYHQYQGRVEKLRQQRK